MLYSFPPSRLSLADRGEVRVAVCLRAHHRTVCAPPVRCLEVVDCSVALGGSSPVLYILADFFSLLPQACMRLMGADWLVVWTGGQFYGNKSL